MGYMNLEQLRFVLIMTLNDDKVLTKKAFNDLVLYATETDDVSPENIFNVLDIHGRGYLTEEDINTMPADLLKIMARAIDPPHGEDADESDDVGDTVLDDKHIEL